MKLYYFFQGGPFHSCCNTLQMNFSLNWISRFKSTSDRINITIEQLELAYNMEFYPNAISITYIFITRVSNAKKLEKLPPSLNSV